MNVSADEYRVGKLACGSGVEDALARCRIAVPPVGPVAWHARTILLAQLRHQLALRQDVPCRIRGFETLQEPLFLVGTEQRALAVEPLRAAVRRDVAASPRRYFAGLLGAVLSAIEHRERHQVAMPAPIVEAHSRIAR